MTGRRWIGSSSMVELSGKMSLSLNGRRKREIIGTQRGQINEENVRYGHDIIRHWRAVKSWSTQTHFLPFKLLPQALLTAPNQKLEVRNPSYAFEPTHLMWPSAEREGWKVDLKE